MRENEADHVRRVGRRGSRVPPIRRRAGWNIRPRREHWRNQRLLGFDPFVVCICMRFES